MNSSIRIPDLKKYYIERCGLTEVKQQQKYRNFLCLGPINTLSVSKIKNHKNISVLTHVTLCDVHIVMFSNAVREGNRKIWGDKLRVMSIKKKFSSKIFKQISIEGIFEKTGTQNCELTSEPYYQYHDDYSCEDTVCGICEENEIFKLQKIKQHLLEEKQGLEFEIELYRMEFPI